jgi:hypothetical protein
MNALFGPEHEGRLALAERFMTMCHVPLALLFGAAFAGIDDRIRKHTPRFDRARYLVPALTLALALPHAWSTTMRDDRRGPAFIHDLFRDVPDGSLMLLTGDIFVQAATYACVVEKTCGSRAIVSPGLLFLDWESRRVRDRYPWLAFPEVRTMKETHRIVEAVLPTRPVFAVPRTLVRDPELGQRFAIEPNLMLIRLYPKDADRAERVAAFRALSRGMVTRASCEGCDLWRDPLREPSFEHQAALAYGAGYMNHIREAMRTGDGDLADRLILAAPQVAF